MGGIIGRLFREFAITLSLAVAVSAFVALTLSPTMCALFLRDEKHAVHGRAYMSSSSAPSTGCWRCYAKGLDCGPAPSAPTMTVFLLTVAVTVALYVEIPKGFFPQQDTGIIIGSVRRAAGHLVRRRWCAGSTR